MSDKVDRIKAALALTFVGDSLSMPVHWYYRQGDIVRHFAPDGITGFEAAPAVHPSSIMSLHSTGRGGRGRQAPEEAVVGHMILKDKAGYWDQPNVHYHHGMPAGENTLNAWCARWMLNWTEQQTADVPQVQEWLAHYVQQMTAEPAAHPDTYAESYHREFFANVKLGQPLIDCGGHTHDTPSMGALVTLAPLALSLLTTQSVADTQAVCRAFVYATHPDDLLMHVVDSYVRLIDRLLNRQPDDNVEAWFIEAASAVPGSNIAKFLQAQKSGIDVPVLKLVSEDTTVIGRTYSPACYITDSWPGVCYLAARYWRAPRTGLLVNTNLGGENAHRGSVLGCLVGLAGADATTLYPELLHYTQIDHEINQWCRRYYA